MHMGGGQETMTFKVMGLGLGLLLRTPLAHVVYKGKDWGVAYAT